jgi:hypothetical protein
MNTATERFDRRARALVEARARTVVHDGELLRHPAYTRVLHWSIALFFVLALLSGFAIYTPFLYRWLTPIFGGGPLTRLLHPWFSLVFAVLFALQVLNWLEPMSWTHDDGRWMRRLREYVANTDTREPDYVVRSCTSGRLPRVPSCFSSPACRCGFPRHLAGRRWR